MSQQQILTGHGVILKIGGRVIGFATGIQLTRTQNTKTIYEIDNPLPVEIAPTTYLVSGSLQGIRLRNQSLDAAGVMTLQTLQSYFNQQYVELEIVDRKTSQTLYLVQRVLFDSETISINVKQIITFNASFKGAFMTNEAGINQ